MVLKKVTSHAEDEEFATESSRAAGCGNYLSDGFAEEAARLGHVSPGIVQHC